MNLLPPPERPPFNADEEQKIMVFAEEYARKGDAIHAMSLAGLIDSRYTVEVAARKLLEKPHVRTAVEMAKRNLTIDAATGQPIVDLTISRETQISRLDDIYREARLDKDRPAALASVKLQSQMLGYLTQTIDLNIHHSASDMTTEQLMKIARRGGAIEGEFKVVGKE